VKKCRWYFSPSPQGDKFAYFDEGHVHVYDMASGQSRNITKDVPTSFVDKEDDHNVVNPPIRPIGWAKDGQSPCFTTTGTSGEFPSPRGPRSNLTVNGKKDGIRYRRYFVLDPEERGIDLSGAVYIDVLAERTKKSGIARLDGGKPGATLLFWMTRCIQRC